MNNRLLLVIGVTLMLLLPVHAQDVAQARTLKIRCLSFQADHALPPLFAHQVDSAPEVEGVPVEVKSYLNHEAESLVMAGAELMFTTSASRAKPVAPDQLIAHLKVPPQLRSVVLMFLPGDGKPGSPRCRILPIDDSTRAFPRGLLKIINLSRFPLRIELEKKAFDFKSGEARLIEDPPVGEANSSAMRSFTFKDKQWQRIGAGNWPHPGTKRVIQLAFDNPMSRQVEMRGIRDIAVRD
jgi:hypothetical protein